MVFFKYTKITIFYRFNKCVFGNTNWGRSNSNYFTGLGLMDGMGIVNMVNNMYQGLGYPYCPFSDKFNLTVGERIMRK